MNIVAIIQARMGSSRLPGKILKEINGKSLISILIDRISMSKYLNKIVIATTNSKLDDQFVKWVSLNLNISIFRGQENDVLDRYYQCAKLYKADVIVRITADDPLKDAIIIDKAISLLKQNPKLDYCSNTIKPTYPEGLDVEVFKFEALYKAWHFSTLPSEREHVTPYIWKNQKQFSLKNFEYKDNLSDWRWTVDRNEDLCFVKEIFKNFSTDFLINYEEIIKFISNNPSLIGINSNFKRNEGYLKSTSEEQ